MFNPMALGSNMAMGLEDGQWAESYTESYSRSAAPIATPALLRRQPATETAFGLHGTRLMRRQPAVQDPNPVLLSRELLPVCYTESYSRSVTPRATPGQLQRELLPVCYTETALRLHGTGLMRRHSSKNRAEQCEPCREGRQGHDRSDILTRT